MDTSNSGYAQAAEDSHLIHFLLLSSNRPAVRMGFLTSRVPNGVWPTERTGQENTLHTDITRWPTAKSD